MGEPITWRTVIGPSLADAARPLSDAVNTLGGASDILDKAIQRQQTVNQGFADRARNAQVQQYLDTVAAAKTPEALAALQQSGQLDALHAQMDPRDQALVRGSDEARRTSLQQQITATDQFHDQQAVQTHQAAIQDVLATAALGTPEAKAAAHAKLAAITDNLPNRGELAAAIEKGYEGVQGFKTADALRTKQAELAGAQTANLPAQIGVETERNRIAARANDIQLFSHLSAGGGGGGGGTGSGAGTPAGADASATTLTGAVDSEYKDDPAKAQTMNRLVAQAIKSAKPEEADLIRQLPPDVVLRVVQAHDKDVGTGKYNPFDFGVAGNIQQDLLAAAKLPSVQREIKMNQGYQALALDRAIGNNGLRARMAQSLFPSTPGAVPTAIPGAAPAPGAPALGNASAGDAAPSGQELSLLATRFKGDAAKIVAAASTSPEDVEAAVGKYGDTWLSHMDKDTQDYVAEETKGRPAVIKGYEGLAAAPTTAPVVPTPTANLPPPTQRFNNPPNSLAGQQERRAFAAQLLQAKQAEQATTSAQAEAAGLLAKGDVVGLSRLQGQPGKFLLLPLELRKQIAMAVNSAR